MRVKGSPNRRNYHYCVIYEGRVEYFTTTKQITEKYGINRSAIYFKVNPDESRIKNKYKDFYIEKLNPPLPRFREEKIDYIS